MPAILLLLAAGCMDYGLDARDGRRPRGELDSALPEGEDAGAVDTAAETGEPDTAADTGRDDETGAETGEDEPEPGSDPAHARPPETGDLVVTELMIDPDAVADGSGEWVEILNRCDAWIDAAGLRLADEGVDDVEIAAAGDLVVGPGACLVVCADADASANGGAACDATFLYETWGGGFALANGTDEVLLLDADGGALDRFAWTEGFAATGAAMGVDPSDSTVSGNDDAAHWCAQDHRMAGGDRGTPGDRNDGC